MTRKKSKSALALITRDVGSRPASATRCSDTPR